MQNEKRVAVVTGATSGIGRWIALGLARAGFHVVIMCRDVARGEAVGSWIAQEVRHSSTEIVVADLSSLAETTSAAREIAGRHPHLSLLVNNAGVFRARYARTDEGHEMVLAVNLLAPFILMAELGSALQAGAPSRIVTVGSSTSDKARIDPANLELNRGWNMVRAYSRSKLAVMMITFETGRRLAGTGVVANVVHPGAVATSLVRSPGIVGWAWRLMAPWLRSEEQGADTPLHVALAEDLAHKSGHYFKDRRAVAPNPLALDQDLARRVWDATEHLVGS